MIGLMRLPNQPTYYRNEKLSDPGNDSQKRTATESDANAIQNADPHHDKYNDPRAKITKRGVLLGLGVAIFGILGAAGSIYARKTRLELSTKFWGQETITALQLAEKIQLRSNGASDFEPVDLTGTPSLGHLRHALLDERSYDWNTESSGSVTEMCQKPTEGQTITCVRIRLTDPTAQRVGTIDIDLDLVGGWIGPADGSRRVQATEWVRPKLNKYFETIVNVQRLRYDFRD